MITGYFDGIELETGDEIKFTTDDDETHTAVVGEQTNHAGERKLLINGELVGDLKNDRPYGCNDPNVVGEFLEYDDMNRYNVVEISLKGDQ